MKHIKLELNRKFERDRRTERGELMKYFCDRINPSRMQEGLPKVTMSRMGKLLEKIPTKDLYYLKSVCDKAKNFSSKFWYELDPEKHQKNKGTPGGDGRFL
ncbi:hypothetical protein HZC00_00650 [Candidatus Kaiserbacteria bacterium]|nr:hypothetical protein [Candidatus Kaiserbacteria bacterium]